MMKTPFKKNRRSGTHARRLGLSLRWKLIAAIILFGTLVTGILSALLFTTTREQMREDFRQRLRDVVGVAALAIEVETHQRLLEPGQEGSAAYNGVKRTLQAIQARADDIHFVYTMRGGADGEIVFVVDAETDPEKIAHLGEVYTDASDFLKANFAALRQPVAETEFYTDRWGTWLTGYAPFFDSAGGRAGVLGIDIAAARILAYEEKLLKLFATVFLMSILLSVLLGVYLGNRLTQPVLALKERAEGIGQGDFDTRIPVRRHDELGVLAHTFNMMSRKLKDLVHDLQNEIASREAAEKKYRSIFENAMEGIFQSTLGGRLITVNPEFARMLGYDSPQEAIDGITDISSQLYAHPDQRRELLDRLNAEGKVPNVRILVLKKDGNELWTELTARLVHEKEGTPRIEGLVKDISEQLAREAAQHEKQVAMATARAKGEFLANMSHEIRTPMNAVMGLTHLALRTDLSPKQNDYLQKIMRAARSLLRIIDDILDFSKIEAGKLSMETIAFDVEEIMKNLATVLSMKAEERGLELIFQLDNQVPRALMGDPFRLEQVLINLVNNAIKFTESGNIILSIQPEPGEAVHAHDVTQLKFSVKDTGIGLTQTQQADLFQSFSQADDSITRKYGGTGLGLTISKRLVEMMGGRIWVESEPGQGSTFSFTAVFKLQDENQPRIFRYPADLRGLKVLVVDDNPTSRDIICEMLESFSLRAQPAPSGHEAIADLEQAQAGDDPFQLVIMDWKMPGMDGVEASRLIKNNTALARIPSILMLTAYSRDEIRLKAEDAGVDSFLIKPANPSLLFDAIMSVFDKTAVIQTRQPDEPNRQIADLENIRGANILLVEDNEINQQVAIELLEAEGFAVQTAANGRVAVEMLSAAALGPEPELVLMDIQMPEMDGYAATQRIRALPGPMAAIPIVAMTAHALQSEKEKCLAAGMNDHVAKPIEPDILFTVLAKWIAPGERETRRRTARPETSTIDIAGCLPHIDTISGLVRVAGNQPLFQDLLIRFARKHAGADHEIRSHIQSARFPEARAGAHTVKGIAGNLGAAALQAAAGDLESALTAGPIDAAHPLLDGFSRALTDVLSDIGTLEKALARPPHPRPSGADAPIDLLKISDVITQVSQLIQSDYALALQQAALLKDLLGPTDTSARVDELVSHMEAFEEAEALNCLDQIADLLGIPIGER